MTLEVELERTKHSSESGAAKISASQVDAMRARYEKVKQELEGFKEERRRKENAYKLMQRETRSCSALQQEIQKLKEGRVALMKQQKATAQLIQKLKKEQQTLEVQNKRSEVANSKQLNTLKSELGKKERVLSLKDKEMNRVCSKLKSCEDHIAHLLKVNRQRSKQMGPQRPSPDSDMNASDTEELLRSKKLLDEYLNERAHLNCARSVYEKRVGQLDALNKELSFESSELESHVSRLRDCVDEGESESLRRLVRSGEAAIDKITHELDIYNSDLDEIASRIGSLEKTSGNGGLDKLSREILSTLGPKQLQALAMMLIQDKLDAVEAQREAEEAAQEAGDRSVALEERLRGMESAAKRADREFRAQLGQAERQRCDDVWSVMKAKDGDADQAIADMVDSVGQHVAINRALDLERELESRIAEEDSLRTEIARLRGELQANELKSQLRQGQSMGCLDTEGADALQSLWAELGMKDSDREKALEEIRVAASNTTRRLVIEAQSALVDSNAYYTKTISDIRCVCEVFKLNAEEYLPQETAKVPLSKRNEAMQLALSALSLRVGDLIRQLFEIKNRLLNLVGEMQLKGQDVSDELRSLLKLGANEDVVQVASFLKESGLFVSEASLAKWKDELSKVNASRAGSAMKAVAVRSLVVGLVKELDIEVEGLKELVTHPSLSLHPKEALEAAVAIIQANSATNPPGSAAILEALQGIYKYLSRVKSNREIAFKHLTVVLQFLSCYCEKSPESIKSAMGSLTKAGLLRLVDGASDTIVTLCESKQEFESKMSEFWAEISEMATGIAGGPVTASGISQGARKVSSADLFQPMTRAVEQLLEESPAFEEVWLRLAIQVFQGLWKSKMFELMEVMRSIFFII